MSTEADFSGATLSEALRQIDSISKDAPIATTLTELQLVVERLTFSKLYEQDVQDDPATLAEIDLFFRDAVSSGMVQFIRWMAQQNLLRVLSGKQGRVFLDYCISAYRKVQEVRVLTAVDLDDDFKTGIANRLRVRYPQPSRIIFSTVPSIIAGVVIDSGQSVTDLSLRNHVAGLISRGERFKGLAENIGGNVG